MLKSEIKMHRDGYGPMHPALKVKVYNFGPSVAAVVARFSCTEKDAEHALELAWDSACAEFWNLITHEAESIFKGGHCYSEGRSSGWLTMHGLADVESWNGAMLAKWNKLARIVRDMIDSLCDHESIMENIAGNEWHKPGAEQYNFVEGKDGESRCIADMKAEAKAAGFGPVVRP